VGRKLAILLMIAVLLSGCVKVDYLVDSEFMPLTAKSAKTKILKEIMLLSLMKRFQISIKQKFWLLGEYLCQRLV